MLSRRQLLRLTAETSVALASTGCATSPPLKKGVFEDFGDPARPYLGLATSLKEEHCYQVRVAGCVPDQLRGTLYRNGPGLFDRGGLRKRNLLDGDGMVQSFCFCDSGVLYRNRFVRTRKYLAEEAAGRFLYPSWSTQAPGGFWSNFLGVGELTGQAGITVYLWRGKLYAFDECALPYQLDPETLATEGISRLGLPEGFSIYAAHAKLDPRTGDWLHFGILYGPSPKLHITIFAADGSLRLHRALPMPRNVYMHDWFVSPQHLVFNFHPVHIGFLSVFLGRKSLVDSLSWKPEQGNLIMVLDRHNQGAPPIFLETEARFMWHSCNAFEQGGQIVADFVGYQNPDHFVGSDPVASAVMSGRRGNFAFPGKLQRYLITPQSRQIRRETFAEGSYEWPRINEMHRCQNYRFVYLVKTRPGEFFWTILNRFDTYHGGVHSYDFGAGCYLTEPVYVPLPGRSYRPDDPREEGFVLVEAYDSATRKSFLAVLRAEDIAAGPVAVVHLEHHAPFSYHGWWSAHH